MNNTITLIGRVGGSPVVTTFESGKQVARFSLAVKEFVKGREPETLWVDCECWGQMAERVAEYVQTGKEVGVQGRLGISRFTKNVRGEDVEIRRAFVRMTSFRLMGARAEVQVESADAEDSQKKGFKLSDSKPGKKAKSDAA